MDHAAIESLKKAHRQSPDNLPLLLLLARALFDARQFAEAATLLRKSLGSLADAADRRFAAQVFLAAEDASSALTACTGHEPEDLILRARAHLSLRQLPQGLEAYRQAVARNPSLEDVALAQALKAQLVDLPQSDGGNVVSFAVLSNERRKKEEEADEDSGAASYLEPRMTNVMFKDVGGLEDVKAQIHRRIILPFQKPSLFQKFKREAGGGVLLYGPPGCGKTLLARATAGECRAKFYNVAISDILDMYIGESEKKLAAVFAQARRTTPAVVFFDELEALAGKRQYKTDQAGAKLVSQFLAEMDGFNQSNKGVLILAATNVPWAIDPAFRRPGRFDRIQFIPPPDREARASILGLLLADRPVAADIDAAFLAKNTSGFSGADLRNLVETACDIAIAESIDAGKEKPVTSGHLAAALKEIKPTTLEWLTTARNYARYANEGGQYDDVLEFLSKHGM
jgi:SpoVK/Ycf46/Vps4 family AAA+-type ATPase